MSGAPRARDCDANTPVGANGLRGGRTRKNRNNSNMSASHSKLRMPEDGASPKQSSALPGLSAEPCMGAQMRPSARPMHALTRDAQHNADNPSPAQPAHGRSSAVAHKIPSSCTTQRACSEREPKEPTMAWQKPSPATAAATMPWPALETEAHESTPSCRAIGSICERTGRNLCKGTCELKQAPSTR